MRFQELVLHHVGPHNGLVLTHLQEGLNVVYGPNEAGKSTTLLALRGMLFGKLEGREPEIIASRAAMGTLKATAQDGTLYTLNRILGKRSPVEVSAQTGWAGRGDDALFSAFPELRDVEAGLYQGIFTFQLAELNDLSQHREALADRLYTVGMLGSTSPLKMETVFQNRAKEIFNPNLRARKPALNQCIQRARQLRLEERSSSDEMGRFLALRQNLQELQQRVVVLQEQVGKLQEEREGLLKRVEALPVYRQAERASLEIQEIGETIQIPQNEAYEVDSLQRRRPELLAKIQDVSNGIVDVEKELVPDARVENLLRRLSSVEELVVRYQSVRQLAQWLQEHRQDELAVKEMAGRQLRQLSGDWTPVSVLGLRLNLDLVSKGRSLVDEWLELTAHCRHLDSEVQRLKPVVHQQLQQAAQRLRDVMEFTKSVPSATFALTTDATTVLQREGGSGGTDGNAGAMHLADTLDSPVETTIQVTEATLEARLRHAEGQLEAWQRSVEEGQYTLEELAKEELVQQSGPQEAISRQGTVGRRGGKEATRSNRRLFLVPMVLGLALLVMGIWWWMSSSRDMAWTWVAAGVLLGGWSLWARRSVYGKGSVTDRDQAQDHNPRRGSHTGAHAGPHTGSLSGLAVLPPVDEMRLHLSSHRRQQQIALQAMAEARGAVGKWRDGAGQLEACLAERKLAEERRDELRARFLEVQREMGWPFAAVSDPQAWLQEVVVLANLQGEFMRLDSQETRSRQYLEEVGKWLDAARMLLGDLEAERLAAGDREAQGGVAAAAETQVAEGGSGASAIATEDTQERLHWILHLADTAALQETLASLAGVLENWLEQGRMAAAQERNRNERASDLRNLYSQRQQLESEVAEVDVNLAAIYDKYGADGPEAFARLVEKGEALRKTQAVLRAARLQLQTLFAGSAAGGNVDWERHLSGWTQEGLQERLKMNLEERREREFQVNNLHKQIGETEARLSHWDTKSRVDFQWNLAQTKSEVNDLALQWAGLKLAEGLLRKAREEYERNRQPRLLESAGRLLREISGNGYVGLESRLRESGQADIVARGGDGQVWPLVQLSRGTREQIYLCLRLALVEDYARRGVVLPLVMDDPMVNFDSHRLAASIGLLERIQCTQIIYLTCHHSMVEKFQALTGAHITNMHEIPRGDPV